MRSITVDKAQLLKTLETNQAEHLRKHETAMERYVEKATEWFEANLALMRDGNHQRVERLCPWPVPVEHAADYQRVIDMLGWDLGNTYDLDEADYRQYVDDQWGWAREFAASNAAYFVE
jgi:hypothetical protein